MVLFFYNTNNFYDFDNVMLKITSSLYLYTVTGQNVVLTY